MTETVTIAILAKNKAHCLPTYLICLLNQTFPKNQTRLYIRTNDNTDSTDKLLEAWIRDYGHLYLEVYYDSSSIDTSLLQYSPHDWNSFRFSILGKIRQESINYARIKNSHYFVADCDNFFHPQTIESLLKTNLPVVGPFLVTGTTLYSNFHHAIDHQGYFIEDPEYMIIHQQKITGLIEVPVVHCTYLIRNEVLPGVNYLPDGTGRHEYVLFSEELRKRGIKQYLDNRVIYGYITFADNIEDLNKEPWFVQFPSLKLSSF